MAFPELGGSAGPVPARGLTGRFPIYALPYFFNVRR